MPAPKKYPDELRERAVSMVFGVRERTGQAKGAIARVADQLGINRVTLRNWVRQAEIDSGQRPGTSTADKQRTLGRVVRPDSRQERTTASMARRQVLRLAEPL